QRVGPKPRCQVRIGLIGDTTYLNTHGRHRVTLPLATAVAPFYNFHIFLNGIKLMKTPRADAAARLEKVEDEFVELWNNMASLWGVSPTMARIHGLLYITGASLSMDDIMARLGISRGNVSMNLSKLLEWALVRRVHKRGDRREYY